MKLDVPTDELYVYIKTPLYYLLNYIIREYLNFQLIWLSLSVPHPELSFYHQ